MAEYINKEEALGRIYHDLYGDVFDIIEMIETEPTIDIVHCSECKYAKPHEYFDVARQETILGVVCKNALFHYADWFCADGETKGESK